MIDVRKLSTVGAGKMLILHLRPHGRCMLFMPCRLFRRSCLHLHPARSAVEAYAFAATAVIAHGAIVNVMHEGDVHVVVGTVVVEMATAPVASLVAEANVAKAVIDAAIEADVRTPIATVKAIAVVPVAPVAGGPKSTLVGSLNPPAGHPVVA